MKTNKQILEEIGILEDLIDGYISKEKWKVILEENLECIVIIRGKIVVLKWALK